MTVWRKTVEETLGPLVTEAGFLDQTAAAIASLGFEPGRTLACAGVCRDEICRSLPAGVGARFGHIFKLTALGGMLFLGKTGIGAARCHAPDGPGRHRFLLIALPHIAIEHDGAWGRCHRAGQAKPTHACGALAALQQELASGHAQMGIDPLDLEQSFLRIKMLNALTWGQTPDLPTLTKVAQAVIEKDLRELGEQHFGEDDYAVATGIQVHAPDGSNHVAAPNMWAMVEGQEYPLAFTPDR